MIDVYIIFLTDSTKIPSGHSGIADNHWDGNNENHRHHMVHAPSNFHHHNHPLLSPQLDNAIAERSFQANHGGHSRGITSHALPSSRVTLNSAPDLVLLN